MLEEEKARLSSVAMGLDPLSPSLPPMLPSPTASKSARTQGSLEAWSATPEPPRADPPPARLSSLSSLTSTGLSSLSALDVLAQVAGIRVPARDSPRVLPVRDGIAAPAVAPPAPELGRVGGGGGVLAPQMVFSLHGGVGGVCGGGDEARTELLQPLSPLLHGIQLNGTYPRLGGIPLMPRQSLGPGLQGHVLPGLLPGFAGNCWGHV